MSVAMVGLIAAFVVWLQAQGSYLESLAALPLAFGLLHYIFPALRELKRTYIGMQILFWVLVAKFVVGPVIWSFGLDAWIGRGRSPSHEATQTGIVLMLAELATVYLVVQFGSRRLYRQAKQPGAYEPISSRLPLVLFAALGMAIFVAIPAVRQRYSFFLSEFDRTDVALDLSGGDALPMVADLALVIVPLLILDYIKKRYDLRPTGALVLMALLAVLPLMTVYRGTSRFSVLIPTLAWTLILLKLFPQSRRFIAGVAVVIMVSVFGTLTFNKQLDNANPVVESQGSGVYAAGSLNGYLAGPENMGLAVEVARGSGQFGLDNLRSDLLNNVAVLSRFATSSETSGHQFNAHYYGRPGVVDQIIPVTGQSYGYLGMLGATVFIALAMLIMMWMDNRAFHERRIEFTYAYTYATAYWAAIPILSLASVLPVVTNLLLPMLVLFGANRAFGAMLRGQRTASKRPRSGAKPVARLPGGSSGP